jgi:F-type H+-transporting ATPase subunit delta
VSRRIARPYAAALFGVIGKQPVESLRAVEAQLDLVAEVFRREPKLLRAFESPTATPVKKRELLTAIGKAIGVGRETERLLAALSQHYRLRFLGDVVALFRDLVDRREGMVRGHVEVASPLDATRLAALATALQESMGTRVELDSRVKPELLAGFVVRLGSRVYDGSLRSQVQRFAHAAGRR